MSHRRRYFTLLNQTREAGQWEEWLEFFANAVASTATLALERLDGLHTLVENDRSRVAGSGRAVDSVMKVYSIVLQSLITTANELVAATGLTHATVDKALVHLECLGITRELATKRRNSQELSRHFRGVRRNMPPRCGMALSLPPLTKVFLPPGMVFWIHLSGERNDGFHLVIRLIGGNTMGMAEIAHIG